jgi:YHS domain-containing protein
MEQLSLKHLVLMITASVLMLAGVWGMAQGRTDTKSIICPVMPSRSVNIEDATRLKMYGDYKGRRYYLCCAPCVTAFAKNPEAFAKGPSLPVPRQR